MAADAREQRGEQIAEAFRLTRKGEGWLAPSRPGKGRYAVSLTGPYPRCTRPDREEWGNRCKHPRAVEYTIRREQNPDGATTEARTLTVTEAVTAGRPTCRQDGPNYNSARTREKEHFLEFLSDLCSGIKGETPPANGQKRLPLQDALFSVVFKAYSTVSGRRFRTDPRDAAETGHTSQTPHFNSTPNYLENPAVADILRALITRPGLPLKPAEVDFACDSSGFMTPRFGTWFDRKYGAERQKHERVKVRLMCGVKTNVVAAAGIRDEDAADTKLLPDLVDATAKNFRLSEASADEGYGSLSNSTAIDRHGATRFIAFESIRNGAGGGPWAKMFHYFSFRRADFLGHYHKRGNVESTFRMTKAKFGDAVRSKTDVAQKNEVLAEILCHNIVCLIHEVYELGVSPVLHGYAG